MDCPCCAVTLIVDVSTSTPTRGTRVPRPTERRRESLRPAEQRRRICQSSARTRIDRRFRTGHWRVDAKKGESRGRRRLPGFAEAHEVVYILSP
jgi:hypothetical protein